MKNFFFLLWIILSILIVGCEGNQANTAVQYLEALNDRDLETARNLVCEARQDDVTMGLVSVDEQEEESFSFINISCSPRGDDVLCRYTVEQTTQSAEITGVQRPREIVFDFEGDKVCGFEEQVGQ